MIIKAHISTGNRQIERPAGFCHSLDPLPQLPEKFRVKGIPVVEVVRQAERHRTGTSQIPASLGHQEFGSFPRIQRTPAAVAVQRHGHPHPSPARLLHPQHGGIASRPDHGSQTHHVVVLVPNPLARTGHRRLDNLQEVLAHLRLGGKDLLQVQLLLLRQFCRKLGVPFIHRGIIRQHSCRDVGHHLSPLFHHDPAGVGHGADLGRIQAPAGKNLLQLRLPSLVNDDEHPLLRLGEKRLIRRHARFPLRHFVQFDLDARAAPAGRFAGGTGQPGRAHVLHSHHQIRFGVKFETRFKKQFPDKRIPHLHGRSIGFALFRQVARGEGRAGQPVPTRFGPHIKHRIAHSFGRTPSDLVVPENPQTENVHQRVALVSRIEHQLPSHGGHAHAVAIMGNSGHHSVDQRSGPLAGLPGGIGPAEPQRIHEGHRTGAHRENVAKDTPHAGGRPLEWLHRTGMIVGFDFEGQGQPVPGIHHSGVFLPGFDQHRGSGGRKFFQLPAGIFVGAVLAPHHRKHAQFRLVGLPAQALLDPVKLLGGQPELEGEIFCLHSDLPAPAAPRRIPRPSIPPISGSQQRSGCGIIPRTLPSRLRIPAMFRLEPLGLASGVTRPWPSQ